MRKVMVSIFVVGFLWQFSSLMSCGSGGSSGVTDKFSLWQNPSFFRGATIHPYLPYGEPEGRTYMTQEDFQALRDAGANVISLNYPGPYQVNSPYDIDGEALQYLDNAVTWARQSGLYVILHFRNGPGKSEDTFGSGEVKKDETLWYSTVEQDKWIEMWRFTAGRYRDFPEVVGYNLMVEPHPDLPVAQAPLSASVWNDLAKRISAGIREVDSQTPIIVSAITYANPVAFPDLQPTGDSRTLYSFHMYEPFNFTHQGFDWAGTGGISGLVYPGLIPSDLYAETKYWDKTLLTEFLSTVKAFQVKHNVPIHVGEYGCNRRVPSCVNYFTDLLAIFEEQGWSDTFFNWRDLDDFDYEKGVTGEVRTTNSEYLNLFRERWRKNQYVGP